MNDFWVWQEVDGIGQNCLIFFKSSFHGLCNELCYKLNEQPWGGGGGGGGVRERGGDIYKQKELN